MEARIKLTLNSLIAINSFGLPNFVIDYKALQLNRIIYMKINLRQTPFIKQR